MKMMNIEMEFVAFDAQDVIATSGELTAKFTVSGDLYSGLGNVKDVTYAGDGKWNFNGDHRQWLWVNESWAYPTDGTTYILTAGVSSYEGYISNSDVWNCSLTLMDVTEGTTADVELNSLSDIVAWLNNPYGEQ